MLRDSTVTLLTRVIVFVIAILNSIIVSRMLGPSQKGSFSIILLVLTLAQLVTLLGIGAANVYFGARDRATLPMLAGNSLMLALTLGTIGAAITIGLTFIAPIETYFLDNGIEPLLMRWTILVLPVVLLYAYWQEIVRADGRIALYNLLSIAFVGAYLATLLLFVVSADNGLTGAVIARVTSYGLTALLTVGIVLTLIKGRMRLNRPILRSQFNFGLRLYPGNLAQFLNYRFDVFLVGYFLTPTEVGLYATATMLAEKLWEFPSAIRTVLLYRVAVLDSAEQAAQLTARVCRIVLVTLGAACLIVAIIAWPLVVLMYGVAFAPSALPLVLLLPGVWLLGVGKLLAIHMAGSGKPEVGTTSAVAALVVTIVLDLALIPLIGMNGAAIASTVSYTVATLYLISRFVRHTNVPVRDVLIVRGSDIALLWSAAMLIIGRIRGFKQNA